MLKELFELIGWQAVKANGIMTAPVPGGPKHAFYLKTEDGVSLEETKPEPRKHSAFDLTTIVAMAKNQAVSKNPAIWYSHDGIVLLTDDGTRRDRIELKLELSPQLNAINMMDDRSCIKSQKELIYMLRTTFRDCLEPAGNILAIIRNLQWKIGQDGSGVIAHGKESIGRKIMNEVTGAGTIPEYITLAVPIFDGVFPFTSRIDLALDMDIPNEKFSLTPIPGQITRAIEEAEQRIGETIDGMLGDSEDGGMTVNVYYGRP